MFLMQRNGSIAMRNGINSAPTPVRTLAAYIEWIYNSSSLFCKNNSDAKQPLYRAKPTLLERQTIGFAMRR